MATVAEQADASVARAYANAVFHRARTPMEPVEFEVDWADQPSRHSVYRGAVRVPLPDGTPAAGATYGDAVAPRDGAGRPARADDVATLLRCYGVVQRRLRINWNGDDLVRQHYPHTTWARPTASGGGMYPVELYWVAGPRGPLLPGVYHYATGHHELERLALGDVSGRVEAALGGYAPAAETDQFLVLTLRFWKNAFKYASFCYHVVTQDLGALLGSWDLVSRASGVALAPALWFDEQALDDLLGLDPDTESVHAVVPLPWAAGTGDAAAGGGIPPGVVQATDPARPPGSSRVVRTAPFERSRRVLQFDTVRAVHRATRVGPAPRPTVEPSGVGVRTPAGEATVDLPPVPSEVLAHDLTRLLLTRRSSFGALTANPRSGIAEVGSVLACASVVRDFPRDVRPAGARPWTRLALLANHVDGLQPGVYDYAADGHHLVPVRLESMTRLLQRSYFLTNYNLEQVAAFLAVVGRPDAMIDAFGDRGYRMLNAEVGAVAQAVYCAATATGLGCGAVLGIDNLTINEALGIDGGDERTLLFLLLGRERAGEADLDSALVRTPSAPAREESRP